MLLGSSRGITLMSGDLGGGRVPSEDGEGLGDEGLHGLQSRGHLLEGQVGDVLKAGGVGELVVEVGGVLGAGLEGGVEGVWHVLGNAGQLLVLRDDLMSGHSSHGQKALLHGLGLVASLLDLVLQKLAPQPGHFVLNIGGDFRHLLDPDLSDIFRGLDQVHGLGQLLDSSSTPLLDGLIVSESPL